MTELSEHPIMLYDGVCGLCNRFVRLLLSCDRDARFRYAALQSTFAAQVLGRHGFDPADLDTFYVVEGVGTAGEHVRKKSDGVLWALGQLGGVWVCARGLLIIPRVIRDAGYDVVAHLRYRLFGRYDVCPVPEPEYRERFIEIGST